MAIKKTYIQIINIALGIVMFFFIYQNSYANTCSSSCQIVDAPAPLLEEYILQNQKIIQNINNDLAKIAPPKSSIANKISGNIYNALFNWADYFTSSEYAQLELAGEIPSPIKRDLALLKEQTDFLTNYLETLLNRGYTTETIENVCSGISNCKLPNTLKQILATVIKNNNDVTAFFRLSIMGRQVEFQRELLLVNDNFKSEMYNYYNKFTIENCGLCNGESGEKSQTFMQEIGAKLKLEEEGIQTWKDAITLLRGGGTNPTAQYQKKERELLQKELQKQGVSGNAGEAILKNLDNYNNNAFSSVVNRIENTINAFSDNIDYIQNSKPVSDFTDTWQQFWSDDDSAIASISISEVLNVGDYIESKNNILQELDILYQKQIPFLSAQDLNSEKLQSRIIKMHIDLSQSINILDKTIPSAEKVCNDQDQGSGKCSY